MQSEEIINWVRLYQMKGVGPALIVQLVDAFGGPSQVLQASEAQLIQKGFNRYLYQIFKNPPTQQIPEAKIKKFLESGVSFITYQNDVFPQRLKQIPSFPPFLFTWGDVDLLNKDKMIALVGTRSPTHYGANMAKQLTSDLVDQHFVIVSGFALGIDIICHQACFERGGKTIAVLAHGLDTMAPASHKKYIKPLLDAGGLFVTEFLPGQQPFPGNFPRRNRIISGLSKGVVVIEAKERSGALITSRYAVEQNRDVFAVPGDAHSEFSRGPHRLIQSGAKLIMSTHDILDEWNYEKQIQLPFEKVTKSSDAYINMIQQGKDSVDEIVKVTSKNPQIVMARLTELEIEGKITLMAGGRYRII
ncbi:MAG: hypothetical protein ACD_73C00812G0003 [uncultured bacterium]|nr:MAG: hypothetical protein ACD_73C00812G0003 [uncultured bacterium]